MNNARKVKVGKAFGFDFGNVSPTIRLVKSETADCITLTTRFGPAYTDLQMTTDEFLALLDAGAGLMGGVVYLDSEDADSEL